MSVSFEWNVWKGKFMGIIPLKLRKFITVQFFSWSTHWFKIHIELPAKWLGGHVVLKWNSNSEAMVWKNGQPLQVFLSFLFKKYENSI